jgi:hypothetical protein
MEPSQQPVQRLDYHAPPPAASTRRRVMVVVLLAGIAAVCLMALSWFGVWSSPRMSAPTMSGPPAGSGSGTVSSSTGGSGNTVPAVTNAVAPGLIGAADQEGQAAAAATTDVMGRLLAGKADDDAELAPVARRLKAYTTWAVTSAQRQAGDPPTWEFGGWVEGPQGACGFSVLMVKQKNGTWAVGALSGPNPK